MIRLENELDERLMNDAEEADRADMEALKAGQEAALERLVDRHGPVLLRHLRRMLAHEADAADLAQETFARVYLHRDRYDPSRRFSTWLFTIASNLARNHIRWRRRHGEESIEGDNSFSEGDGLGWHDVLPGEGPAPLETLEQEERSEAVRRVVDGLPERMRAAILLVDLEDRSVNETAEILGVPARTVESRLFHGRRLLRERLGFCRG